MRESWQNLYDLIVRPSATFTRLKSRPRWVLAFVLFVFIGIGLLWTIAPFTVQLINNNQVAKRVTHGDQSIKVATFESYLARGGFVLILWSIFLSFLLLFAARVFKVNRTLKFKHIYSGVVHFSLITTIVYFINAGILPLFRRVEDMQEAVDLKIIPGLHLLAGPIDGPHLLTFLSHINPLNAWYVFVIIIAVSVMAEVNKIKACCVALIIFLLRVGAEIAFLATSLD